MEQTIYEVSQVNAYLKQKFDGDPMLSRLLVRGELSNYKVYPSGHHYFTMKDAGGALRCVMFKGSAMRLRFRPENGMQVLVSGRITVYPRDGAYQFYAEDMMPEGAGDLSVAFEQLKAKLAAEGLFAPEHKKPLPAYPHRIALVTSSAGAAVRDMLRILGKRYPLSKVILLPVRVQGEEAPAEIAGALRYVNRFQLADVIITGRGGGSIEDLWAFNDERVARAIYLSEIPVVSAVGHEPDVTIADYVADLRAATPSNGAELVAPDQMELRQQLDQLQSRMAAALSRQLHVSRQRLERYAGAKVLQSPMAYVEDRRRQLELSRQRLAAVAQRLVDGKKREFVRLTASLDAMSPLKVLGRGYALTRDAAGHVIKSTKEVSPGDRISVRLADGALTAAVETVEESV